VRRGGEVAVTFGDVEEGKSSHALKCSSVTLMSTGDSKGIMGRRTRDKDCSCSRVL